MDSDGFARQIFLALLARDPLASQRFTEIDTRMEQLIALSRHLAAQWDNLHCKDAVRSAVQRIWDNRAADIPTVPLPEKLLGAGKARAPDLFSS